MFEALGKMRAKGEQSQSKGEVGEGSLLIKVGIYFITELRDPRRTTWFLLRRTP
jgi:hypothetical protein